MKDPNKIDWSKVQGLDLGLYRFSNEDNHPITWNEETKTIEVLENGEVILCYKKSQVRDVIYK